MIKKKRLCVLKIHYYLQEHENTSKVDPTATTVVESDLIPCIRPVGGTKKYTLK